MGKRSDFKRIEKDKYRTWDPRAIPPLLDHLPVWTPFFEPCAGDGALIRQLELKGHTCRGAFDIEPEDDWIEKRDALTLTEDDLRGVELIITNPPWTRSILHPLIVHLSALRPTWLLFDASWAFTLQSRDYMNLCSDIVPVGRLKWIEDSAHQALDDVAWYRFEINRKRRTTFWPRLKYGEFNG